MVTGTTAGKFVNRIWSNEVNRSICQDRVKVLKVVLAALLDEYDNGALNKHPRSKREQRLIDSRFALARSVLEKS